MLSIRPRDQMNAWSVASVYNNLNHCKAYSYTTSLLLHITAEGERNSIQTKKKNGVL